MNKKVLSINRKKGRQQRRFAFQGLKAAIVSIKELKESLMKDVKEDMTAMSHQTENISRYILYERAKEKLWS